MKRNSSYLEHHGVKGMHWGIRRYQDYDGKPLDTARIENPRERIEKYRTEGEYYAQRFKDFYINATMIGQTGLQLSLQGIQMYQTGKQIRDLRNYYRDM